MCILRTLKAHSCFRYIYTCVAVVFFRRRGPHSWRFLLLYRRFFQMLVCSHAKKSGPGKNFSSVVLPFDVKSRKVSLNFEGKRIKKAVFIFKASLKRRVQHTKLFEERYGPPFRGKIGRLRNKSTILIKYWSCQQLRRPRGEAFHIY